MTTLVQNSAIASVAEQKTLKNEQTEEKIMENTTKTMENEVKATDDRPLEVQYKELKKKNPKLVNELKAKAKAKVTKKPVKEPEREVTPMKEWRNPAEEVLIATCKKLKMNPPERARAMATSKSGVGALQVRVNHEVVASVRSNDIVIYRPCDVLGYGEPDKGEWGRYVTRMKASDPKLGKAFEAAFKDKKAPSTYAKERGFYGRDRADKVKEVTLDAIKAQEAKLAEMRAALKEKQKEQKKAKTPKPKKPADAAITAVAEPSVA